MFSNDLLPLLTRLAVSDLQRNSVIWGASLHDGVLGSGDNYLALVIQSGRLEIKVTILTAQVRYASLTQAS